MKKKLALEFEKDYVIDTWPDFRAGDTLSVSYLTKEGDKERVQVFRGTCIGRRGSAMGAHFTVRKVTQGCGVERSFPLSSPFIKEIKVDRLGKVKRAKLYYLRDRTGRSTRITERIEHDTSKK